MVRRELVMVGCDRSPTSIMPKFGQKLIQHFTTTLIQGFGLNHCLCHGDLGNLELLLQASLTLDEPKWRSQVNRLAAIILESINQHGWLCGVPLAVETPGLMTGLAGIGKELLRLAEPTRIPSVLTLAPPISFPISAHPRKNVWHL